MLPRKTNLKCGKKSMIWRNNKGRFYIVMINLVLKAKERDSRKLNQIKIFFD
jgi:hypothetical protein